MNKKEISEIKRLLKNGKSNTTRIHGRYVNPDGAIIAVLQESVSQLSESEAGQYFDLFRSVLSGKPGNNLLELGLSREQEAGPSYRRLLRLHEERMQNQHDLDEFFFAVIDQINTNNNYVVLLMQDEYDVPEKNGGPDNFNADETFRYMVCAICPVKSGKSELGYMDSEKRFLNASIRQLIDKPVLGFMFPSFNDRSTDIHHLTVFCKNRDSGLSDLVRGVLGEAAEAPMTGEDQKEKFDAALVKSLGDECTFDVLQNLHEAFAEQTALQKEIQSPEPPRMTAEEIGDILIKAGVAEERADAFEENALELTTESKEGKPSILIDNLAGAGKMIVETEGVKVVVKPEAFHAVRVDTVRGRKVISIDVQGDCSINGVKVKT